MQIYEQNFSKENILWDSFVTMVKSDGDGGIQIAEVVMKIATVLVAIRELDVGYGNLTFHQARRKCAFHRLYVSRVLLCENAQAARFLSKDNMADDRS